MEQEEESTLDFREMLWKVRRYKWVVLFPIVLVFCGACMFLMITPPVYESALVVSVDDKSPVSRELGTIVGRERSTEDNNRDQVARVDAKIHSRPFLEAIVNRLSLAKNPELLLEASAAAREWKGITTEEYAVRIAVLTLGKQIVVTPSGEAFVKIAAKGNDPRQARSLASMIGDELIAQNKASSLQRATARGEFSADQIAVYEERLSKSEAALRNYQESVIGRRLTSNPINDTNFDTAKELVSDARAEMDQIRSRLQTDLSAWQNAGGAGSGPPLLQNSRTAELESRLGELESSYGMASMARGTEVENLKLKIGGVRQGLYAEFQSLAGALPNLSPGARDAAAGIALDRAELRSLKQKELRLSRLTSDYAHRVESQPTEQLESERLRTEVESNRDLLLALKKEATSSRISAALETTQFGMEFQVLESPQLPLHPVYPDPFRVLGMALFIGPMLGIGLAILAQRLGAALSSLEQAEREIGARVIGTIPRIEGWSQPGGYVQKYWPALSIALVLFATAVFYTLHVTVLKPNPTEHVQPKP